LKTIAIGNLIYPARVAIAARQAVKLNANIIS